MLPIILLSWLNLKVILEFFALLLMVVSTGRRGVSHTLTQSDSPQMLAKGCKFLKIEGPEGPG